MSVTRAEVVARLRASLGRPAPRPAVHCPACSSVVLAAVDAVVRCACLRDLVVVRIGDQDHVFLRTDLPKGRALALELDRLASLAEGR